MKNLKDSIKEINMKFYDLIKNNQWESVKLILLELYPDQTKGIRAYEMVFENLGKMNSSISDIEISLTFYEGDGSNSSSYVDVSGRNVSDIQEGVTDKFFAIEFVPWCQWLGMEINKKTLKDYTELEIIAHCLWEMTFFGYNEEEIQGVLSSAEQRVLEYKSSKNKNKPDN